jgi:hypothetical protein
MDPSQFTDPSDHIRERAASGYGLSVASLRHDMQSADAREAMLEPLRKIRRTQIKTFRRAERHLAQIIAKVLEADASDVAFIVESFGVDFGEPQVLMSASERLTLWIALRQAGLMNTLQMIRALNPDIKSDEEALEVLLKNNEIETERNRMMRPLHAISGSLGADVPDGGTANNNAPDIARKDDSADAKGEQPEREAA